MFAARRNLCQECRQVVVRGPDSFELGRCFLGWTRSYLFLHLLGGAMTDKSQLGASGAQDANSGDVATPNTSTAGDPVPASTAKATTSEIGPVAKQILPHLLNLYNSCPTATDFDALYAPNATFEDPIMRAHGVAQIKSAFYALPKLLQDSTILRYTVEEEQTSPTSGEIRFDSLQQYHILQLGPVGYYMTIQALTKLKVEGGKVVRHEDLWGGRKPWNRDTVRIPLLGRLAETVRRGNMMVAHVLMGFGKDHKTLDKRRDQPPFHLKVS